MDATLIQENTRWLLKRMRRTYMNGSGKMSELYEEKKIEDQYVMHEAGLR